MRPDGQRHGPLSVGELGARRQLPDPGPVTEAAHGGQVGDHQGVDELLAVRRLDPDGDLRPEIEADVLDAIAGLTPIARRIERGAIAVRLEDVADGAALLGLGGGPKKTETRREAEERKGSEAHLRTPLLSASLLLPVILSPRRRWRRPPPERGPRPTEAEPPRPAARRP